MWSSPFWFKISKQTVQASEDMVKKWVSSIHEVMYEWNGPMDFLIQGLLFSFFLRILCRQNLKVNFLVFSGPTGCFLSPDWTSTHFNSWFWKVLQCWTFPASINVGLVLCLSINGAFAMVWWSLNLTECSFAYSRCSNLNQFFLEKFNNSNLIILSASLCTFWDNC